MAIDAVKQFYADRNEFGFFYCQFNHVSVKLYFDNNKMGFHMDVTHDCKTGKAKANNSQQTKTPVAIVSFGDVKMLEFMKHYSDGAKVLSTELWQFLQTSGKMIILDPRDEEFDSKIAHWMHRSQMIDKKTSVDDVDVPCCPKMDLGEAGNRNGL